MVAKLRVLSVCYSQDYRWANVQASCKFLNIIRSDPARHLRMLYYHPTAALRFLWSLQFCQQPGLD